MSQGAAPHGILLLLLTALLAAKIVADNPVWDLNVTTLSGSGATGFADGPATTAKFALPTSIALMPNGSIVVADFDNNRIRMVAPDGTVTTLAGNGAPGYFDGPGASAMFNNPEGVAVMQNGSVVVSEWGHRIRLIAPDGTVTDACRNRRFGAPPTGQAIPQRSIARAAWMCLPMAALSSLSTATT